VVFNMQLENELHLTHNFVIFIVLFQVKFVDLSRKEDINLNMFVLLLF